MEALQTLVTYAALAIGCISFSIYVIEVIAAHRSKPRRLQHAIADKIEGIAPTTIMSATNFAKILEAAAKLGDSLTKAGPALTSLIGAVLFFAIAMVSSGALQTPKPVEMVQKPAVVPPVVAAKDNATTTATSK